MSVRLYSLCVCMMLLAALCPGAHCKRGGIFRGRGKGDGNKESQSQSKGLSKPGLKWVGAAAAGMLGGTGTGYGMGLLGKGKHGSGHKTVSSDQHMYYGEGQRFGNRSQWNAAASPSNKCAVIFGYVVPLLIAAWMRDF